MSAITWSKNSLRKKWLEFGYSLRRAWGIKRAISSEHLGEHHGSLSPQFTKVGTRTLPSRVRESRSRQANAEWMKACAGRCASAIAFSLASISSLWLLKYAGM